MVQEQILSVSRLVSLLQEVVEDNFLQVCVEGEISNFAAPSSGHFYFTLKDSRSQVRAVMFRQFNRLLREIPADGMQVVCRGRLTVYPQRGDVQMAVEHLELCGAGGLQAAFDQLKARLEAEGLFAPERKRELPLYPQTVGVITSATGAAIQDILQVLRRRAAGVRVRLYPVRVQGEGAAAEIVHALEFFNRYQAADVLIVGRGGGSLEDLWAFNEETVARAVFASRIPVISAVGHEVDVTIADFVADRRAPTPSAAAEIVARSCQELETHLDHLELRLAKAQSMRLKWNVERLTSLERRLRSPRQVLAALQGRLETGHVRIRLAAKRLLQQKMAHLEGLRGRLEAYSPLRTLERGYSIVTRREDGVIVRGSEQLHAGDRLALRFHDGTALAVTEEDTP